MTGRLLTIFVLAVLLNYVWELGQTPLYEGTELPAVLWHCFIAALGDGVLVLLIFGAVATSRRSFAWYLTPTRQSYLAMAAVGFVIAVVVEWWGLHITQRWRYSGLMPLVPGTGMGVVPLLQMLVLPPAVFALARRLRR